MIRPIHKYIKGIYIKGIYIKGIYIKGIYTQNRDYQHIYHCTSLIKHIGLVLNIKTTF